MPQIAGRAEELDRWLREVTRRLTPEADLLKLDEATNDQSEELRRRMIQVDDLLAGNPTTLDLQYEDRFWRVLAQNYSAKRESMTPRAAELEKNIQLIEQYQLDWQVTWDHVNQRSEIEPVIERINQALAALRETRVVVEKQLNHLLALQNEVAQMDHQVSIVQSRIQEAQEWSQMRLFEQDSRPLWESRELRNLNQATGIGTLRPFDRSFNIAFDFLRVHRIGITYIFISYFLTLWGAFKLRNHLKGEGVSQVPREAFRVFDSPFSIALLVALIGTIVYIRIAPLEIAFVLYILYLIPVLRLLSPLLEPPLRKLLHAVAVFYLLEALYLLIVFQPIIRRGVHSLIVLAALICFGWLAHSSPLRGLSASRRELRMLMIGIRLGLLLLASSFAANLLGLTSLGQILGLTVLFGAFAGSALYCAARVLLLLFTTILSGDWARPVLETRVDLIERWAWRIIVPLSLLLWLETLSRLLTVYDTLIRHINSALSYPIGFERVHVTLRSILSFLFILVIGYLVSKIVTFLLTKILLTKLSLQRGMPFAISKVTSYVLLIAVFLAALINAGMEINKFTLITGALGVGVGFGLQNIVNNFVSGLILLFERPIRVGDTVELKGLAGTVRRIGARSSTIHTSQDAGVIVPNSNLVSNEVINWTLSSSRRRVDIQLGVAYGTDPESVLSLLLNLTAGHSAIIRNPKPEAFFVSFGESALNFELRFWTYQEDWSQLKSEITVQLIKSLGEAGIVIPFPQRELHIRSVAKPAEDGYVYPRITNLRNET